MNTCEYCKKTFANKSSLMNHIKKTKKCINNRESNESIKINYACEYCNKIFTSKQRLNLHITKCDSQQVILEKKELENKLLEKDKIIVELQSIINTNNLQMEKYESKINELLDTFTKLISKTLSVSNSKSEILESLQEISYNNYEIMGKELCNLLPRYI